MIEYHPFIWESDPPDDCPFEASTDLRGIRFLGRCSDYRGLGDTWYPSWASDNRLYSPYTDGSCPRLDGGWDRSWSFPDEKAVTGQAVLEGEDPLNLNIYSLGVFGAGALPCRGRYPCGSLVHNGIWYYGTYCVGPSEETVYEGFAYNWPWLGPLVGFRWSKDYGRSWEESPHSPEKPLFGENGMWGNPLKIGAPHFADFGRNMEHSPDGKAYLVCHGAELDDPKPRFANLSWGSGDQIHLIHVTPSPENINDSSKYEFFAGHDHKGNPIWTNELIRIRPLIDWNNNCGCVTLTYNAPLRKYRMCVTDAWPTVSKTKSYILEARDITGPWRLVTYMRNFGEQAYFLNIPSKFISENGRRLWLCYSANFVTTWNKQNIKENPPGSHYGLVLQEVELM